MYTGNTQYVSLNDLLKPVYPCAYREHETIHIILKILSGLSLCIQGTQTPFLVEIMDVRFIPVHTGNTLYLIYPLTHKTVYPCAYREHIHYTIIHVQKIGLSLCIQGTLSQTLITAHTTRFIPVHTGNTDFQYYSPLEFAVYPCAYREHSNYNILFYN